MFAVSKNICIFVVPNHLNSSESDKTYRKTVYTTGSLSGDSTSVDSGGLATIQRGLVHSFFIHIINLVFSKMPNHQTKLTDLPNNSTQAVSTIHKFRIRITSHLTNNLKLCANIFGYSKILSIFVLPNKLIHSINPIDSLYFRYKAGFSGLSYFRVDSLFGDIKEGLAHSLLLSTVKY